MPMFPQPRSITFGCRIRKATTWSMCCPVACRWRWPNRWSRRFSSWGVRSVYSSLIDKVPWTLLRTHQSTKADEPGIKYTEGNFQHFRVSKAADSVHFCKVKSTFLWFLHSWWSVRSPWLNDKQTITLDFREVVVFRLEIVDNLFMVGFCTLPAQTFRNELSQHFLGDFLRFILR